MTNLLRLSVLLCCLLDAPAQAQLPSELKASHRELSSKLKEADKKNREALGPLPLLPGFKVADADRKKNLNAQTAVYADEAIKLSRENPDLVIVDLRLPDEFADEHLPGAINVSFVQPYQGFVRQLAKLDAGKPTLLYCDTGKETQHARLGFGLYGFQKLYAMRDGLRGWKEAGGATEGPKQGPKNNLERIPAIVDPQLPPTPIATRAREVSNGPFATIPVSNDFDWAKDFAFDGHGNVSSSMVTFLIRKRADVIAKPFREFSDPRYPKEHVKHWEGIRLHGGDAGGRRNEFVRYRANGDLLTPYFPARGKPSAVYRYRPNWDNNKEIIDSTLLVGLGALGLHTDVANNVWFTGYKPWTQDKVASSLNLLTSDDKHLVLHQSDELKMPWGLVHDANRSLLFYTEPLEKQIWVLPVDQHGQNVGQPRLLLQLPDSEPWGITLDEFGSLYVAAEPNVLRLRLDATGQRIGDPVKLNQTAIERAHQLHFGLGPGFHERSLYVMSTPQRWDLLADVLSGYVNGTYRLDGSVSRQLNCTPALMSPLVRLDLGVRGAPETQVVIPKAAPESTPAPEEKRRGTF